MLIFFCFLIGVLFFLCILRASNVLCNIFYSTHNENRKGRIGVYIIEYDINYSKNLEIQYEVMELSKTDSKSKV